MPNRDATGPKPQAERPELPREAPEAVRLDDRLAMALGSLGFGMAIPWMTGLWGPVRPPEPRFWWGSALFVALAFAIWAGNRWLLLKQREHFDWFSHPLRKLAMLVSANLLYTAPITAAGLAAWFDLAGLPTDRNAIELVVLINVICVLFVTHAYETVFLIRERESDLIRVERLDRLRAQAELAALKAQVDPHFLFNSLNTLGHLIGRDAARATEFCDALADVYRYVLDSRERDLVPLAEEVTFLRRYHRLLALRFGPAMSLSLDPQLQDEQSLRGRRVVPLALQVLLENAVKHNQAGIDRPLEVRVQLEPQGIRVGNDVHPRSSAVPSSGLGLSNLDERCRAATGRALTVRQAQGRFEVEVPLAAETGARR